MSVKLTEITKKLDRDTELLALKKRLKRSVQAVRSSADLIQSEIARFNSFLRVIDSNNSNTSANNIRRDLSVLEKQLVNSVGNNTLKYITVTATRKQHYIKEEN